ncbi:hypothetical protein [Synechococcus sp. CS-1328]|uniref:hypothetical protein n=1 Tax=Synechococcus sp. CS-1328 TaxID=2847976 RepID=UPI00223B9DC7|nr:hypothetical protein [Synechococcus sp. CS-1328]
MHQPQRRSHRSLLLPLAAALLGGLSGLGAAAPAQAGLARPLLMMMKPQLEERLARVCVETASGGQSDLARKLKDPCRQLAGPTSACLIEETDRSGRSLGVVSELVQGRFGDDSEWVVKRCLARLLGLKPESLQDVPLEELAKRFGQSAGTGKGQSRTP